MHATFRGWGGFLRRALTREAPFTPELRERLTRPYPDEESGYALGWHLESHERLGVLWNHPGSNRMWRSQQIVVPEHGFALLLATNQADTAAVRAIDQLAERLLERVPAHLPRSGTRSHSGVGPRLTSPDPRLVNDRLGQQLRRIEDRPLRFERT